MQKIRWNMYCTLCLIFFAQQCSLWFGVFFSDDGTLLVRGPVSTSSPISSPAFWFLYILLHFCPMFSVFPHVGSSLTVQFSLMYTLCSKTTSCNIMVIWCRQMDCAVTAVQACFHVLVCRIKSAVLVHFGSSLQRKILNHVVVFYVILKVKSSVDQSIAQLSNVLTVLYKVSENPTWVKVNRSYKQWLW